MAAILYPPGLHICTAQHSQGQRMGLRLGEEVLLRPATRDGLLSSVLLVARSPQASLVPAIWFAPHGTHRYLEMCTQCSPVPRYLGRYGSQRKGGHNLGNACPAVSKEV